MLNMSFISDIYFFIKIRMDNINFKLLYWTFIPQTTENSSLDKMKINVTLNLIVFQNQVLVNHGGQYGFV